MMMVSTLRAYPMSQHWATCLISQHFHGCWHQCIGQVFNNILYQLIFWYTQPKKVFKIELRTPFEAPVTGSQQQRPHPNPPPTNPTLTWTPALTKTLNILRSPLCEPPRGGGGGVGQVSPFVQLITQGDGHTVTAPLSAQVTDITTCWSK